MVSIPIQNKIVLCHIEECQYAVLDASRWRREEGEGEENRKVEKEGDYLLLYFEMSWQSNNVLRYHDEAERRRSTTRRFRNTKEEEKLV